MHQIHFRPRPNFSIPRPIRRFNLFLPIEIRSSNVSRRPKMPKNP